MKFIYFIGLAFSLSSFASSNLNQCVQDICGAPEENMSYSEVNNLITSEEDEIVISKLIDGIRLNKGNFELETKSFLDIYSGDRAKFLENLSSIDKSTIVYFRKLFPALVIMAEKGLVVPNLFSSLYFYEAEYKKLFLESGMGEEEASWTSELITKFKASYKMSDLFGVLFSRVPEYAISSYSGQYDYSNFRNIVEQFGEIAGNSSTEIPLSPIEDSVFLAAVTKSLKRLNLADLSTEKVRTINTAYVVKELVKQFRNPENESVKDFVNYLESTPSSIWSSIISKFDSEVEELISLRESQKDSLNQNFENVLNTCKTHLIEAYKKLPTKSEIEFFRKYLREVKKEAVNFVKRKISYSMGKTVDAKLAKVQFDLPLAKENFTTYIQNELSKNSRDYTDDEKMIISMSSLNLQELSSKNFPFGALEGSCTDLEDNGVLYDYAVTEEMITVPSIKVSWSVLKNMDRLKSVVTHEIGHQLFAMLRGSIKKEEAHTKTSFNNVKEVLKCVSSIHKDAKSEEYTIWDENGDYHKVPITQYTNEDFSDQLAALVDRDNKFNMACVFMDEENSDYTNLSLVNENEDDTHSSGFFRVLNIEMIRKNNLPESCSGLDDGLKNCLD